MSDTGIKQLSVQNWLIPDEVVHYLTGMHRTEDYVMAVLKPTLSEKVPRDIHAMFDVAKGAMLYGYLYYPLFTIGLEQLYRVGEAAITRRSAELAIPKAKKRFEERIDWLMERGVFSTQEADRWHTLRSLRNSASHPTRQSIASPGIAMEFLYVLPQDINALFDKDPG